MKTLEADVLADAISAAVAQTIQATFSTGAKQESRMPAPDQKLKADVSGILTLSQKDAGGLLVISFPRETICKLLARVYGKTLNKGDPAVNMAVGELTNVVYASAKKGLNENGHELGMAIPSVIVGDQHFVFAHFRGEITEQTFSTADGPFKVYTCLRHRSAAAQAA